MAMNMKMDKHEKIKSKLMGKNASGGLTSGKIIKSDQLYPAPFLIPIGIPSRKGAGFILTCFRVF